MFKIWLIIKYNLLYLGNILPMMGIKNFVFGFFLSLCGIALYGLLPSSSTPILKSKPTKDFEIHLFKKTDTLVHLTQNNLFAPVKKEVLEINETPIALQTPTPIAVGIEDDEILSIGNEDIIPIEFETSQISTPSEVVEDEVNEDKVALLPNDILVDKTEEDETPWITAKGSPNIKNKKLLEQINETANNDLIDDDFNRNIQESDSVSYRVAERIKQSIIFPIPDEILNDENLTPTFINNKKKAKIPTQNQPQKEAAPVAKKQSPLKVTPTKTPVVQNNTEDKGIMDSISSWFSAPPQAEEQPQHARAKRAAPAYNSIETDTKKDVSQLKTSQTNASKSSQDLVNFYESLQETKRTHTQRKIIPSELKLSFQPERAEISGTTLHWLKVFSEAVTNNDNRLQVRLDVSASTELQKKRLNLLYTIFMNNGVNFKKIDTVFSQTEPNTFIIRTIKGVNQ